MFNNIGKKIKTLAKVLCWIGIIVSVLSGIVIMAASGQISDSYNSYSYNYNSAGLNISSGAAVVAGILVIVLGALFSWIGSFVLYGFGQMVDNSDKLVELKQAEIK